MAHGVGICDSRFLDFSVGRVSPVAAPWVVLLVGHTIYIVFTAHRVSAQFVVPQSAQL
jgi:hypothetical protein